MTTKPTKTYALLYPRVSSDRQVKEGHGLDSQTKRTLDYAKSKKYVVFRVFPEEGVTGGLFNRPKMKELLVCIEELKAREPECDVVVIFDDIKRFARDLEIHFALKKEIYGRGARVESPNFNFENSPTGRFTEQVMAAAAELERNQNKLQVIQKMKARAESGHWPFCLPPGLKNIKHPVHGKYAIPDDPIASIFAAAIKGFRDRLLITQLDVVDFIKGQYQQQGINRKISLHGVQRMLTEILYTGYIEYPKWNIARQKGVHEGFISIETYDEVQRILKDRTKPKVRRDTNPEFPLRGLTLCSLCRKPFTASFNTSHNGQRYPNYFCKTDGCPMRYKVIHRNTIENDFLALLGTTKLEQPTIELALAILKDVWNQHQAQYSDAQSASQRQLDEVTEAISRLTNRIAKTTDEVLITSYESELRKLGIQKQEFDSVSFPKRYTSEEFGTATKKVLDVLENPVSMWQNGSLDDRLTVFFMHFDQKPVYDKKTGFGTAILSQSVNVIRSLGSSKIPSVETESSELSSKIIPQTHLQA